MSDHLSTQQLIASIERKDKRFRLFQSLFMIGTFIGLIFIISAQQHTLASVQERVDQDATIAADAREQRTEQLNSITRRLDCMVVFFSTPDRENLTIENVENCSLNRDEDLNKFFQNEPNDSSENPPNLPGSGPTAAQENAEPQGTRSQDPQTDNPAQDTPPAEERPPVTIQTPIVDIPLCVPLTGICVR